nr:enolase C-terminal domain-like protein [Roseibium sp. CAU 1639]
METHRRFEVTAVEAYQAPISAKTTWILLRLSFASGVSGWGEATLFGCEADLATLVARLQASLKVEPARDLADLVNRILQADMSGARGVFASSLEQAWLDGLGRLASAPVHCLLGGAERDHVPFYANINRGIADRSPTGFAERAERILKETGAQALKIAPFDGLRWDRTPLKEQSRLIDSGLQRVAAVKAKLGGGQRLMVDCHARFSPFLAGPLFGELGALGVYWVEEPCAMMHLSAREQRSLRHTANAAGLMLAGAETVTRLEEMQDVLSCEGHDVVLPDLRMTGISAGMAMLRLAASKQVFASLHNPVGPVLDAVSTQVALAAPSFLILERQIGETPKFDEIRKTTVSCVDGAIELQSAPGLGFVPEIAALEDLNAARSDGALSFSGMAGAGPDA